MQCLFSFLDWLGWIIVSWQSLCTTTHWWWPRQQETHLSWNWLCVGAFEIRFWLMSNLVFYSALVQRCGTNFCYCAPRFCGVSECRVLSSTWWMIRPLLAITLSHFIIIIGYLICVPMLEEWQNDLGIQGLDGWTFQVSVYYLLFIRTSFIWYPVFIRVSSALHSWLIQWFHNAWLECTRLF